MNNSSRIQSFNITICKRKLEPRDITRISEKFLSVIIEKMNDDDTVVCYGTQHHQFYLSNASRREMWERNTSWVVAKRQHLYESVYVKLCVHPPKVYMGKVECEIEAGEQMLPSFVPCFITFQSWNSLFVPPRQRELNSFN